MLKLLVLVTIRSTIATIKSSVLVTFPLVEKMLIDKHLQILKSGESHCKLIFIESYKYQPKDPKKKLKL